MWQPGCCLRSSRHGLQEGTKRFDDFIWRIFDAAGIPDVKKPSGLDSQDVKLKGANLSAAEWTIANLARSANLPEGLYIFGCNNCKPLIC